MRQMSERLSYLKGLSEGLNISEASPQGKILAGIIDVLEEMSDMINDIQYDMEDFKEYVESIDDDLYELEESFFDAEDDDRHEWVSTRCPNCGEDLYYEADMREDEDEIELICPHCNELVYVNEDTLEGRSFYDEGDEVYNPNPS
ncbi:hypothetical protein SAMN02745221_00696 [Thermosyntropha lipolytica DSM 11003]|uniref:AraC family transcriptional regulator n=1 Tax=Thermosyntropha lipolytica DSM 11003 TaxID=1123382 RepID=A0A1M5LMJ1_9FIRM|nr:CD1247 N-terminal domain-containing protein [Thermosyntropha lipolytica]SHG65869.1 hypothetical protein SAMN02745221_00696 [Thermosyntropha lipolytica DSM 11003]